MAASSLSANFGSTFFLYSRPLFFVIADVSLFLRVKKISPGFANLKMTRLQQLHLHTKAASTSLSVHHAAHIIYNMAVCFCSSYFVKNTNRGIALSKKYKRDCRFIRLDSPELKCFFRVPASKS